MTLPVMFFAWSLRRKATRAATSSGWPMRPRSSRFRTRSRSRLAKSVSAESAAKLMRRSLSRALHLVPRSDIRLHRHCGETFVAELLHLLVERVRLKIEAGNFPTRFSHEPAGSRADSRSGAGNEHALTVNR